MPPKAKYSKEQITDAAYKIVRKYGESILSARNLAAELGTSTSPIFAVFNGIEEVHAAVTARARDLYKSYLDEGLSQEIPFKGAGLKYVQFAKDEPELFKLLFMKSGADEPSHYMPSGFEFEAQVRERLQTPYDLDEATAKNLYNHLSVYVHGLAVLFAQGNCVFSDDDVSRMISEIFIALRKG